MPNEPALRPVRRHAYRFRDVVVPASPGLRTSHELAEERSWLLRESSWLEDNNRNMHLVYRALMSAYEASEANEANEANEASEFGLANINSILPPPRLVRHRAINELLDDPRPDPLVTLGVINRTSVLFHSFNRVGFVNANEEAVGGENEAMT